MAQTFPEAEFVSVTHWARIVDASTKTVRRWLLLPDDPLPAIRLGDTKWSRIRIPRREAVAWLERRRAVPAVHEIVDEIVGRVTQERDR